MKIFLIGLPGAGKSYWAKQLSSELGIPSFDLDQEIEQYTGKSIPDIFKEAGEQKFRLIEQQVLKRICQATDPFILACGGGTPCFNNNLEIIKENGKSIYLKHSKDQIIKHLSKQSETEKRPLFNEISVAKRIRSLLTERKRFYEKADHILEMDRLHQNEVIASLKNIIVS